MGAASAVYGLPSHASAQHLHRHDSGAVAGAVAGADALAGDGSVHRGVSNPIIYV